MAAKHPEAKWFEQAKFGIFMHWGTYSLRGIEASWPLKPGNNQHLPVEEYEALAQQFNPQDYDPVEWAEMAKQAGAKYVVLTAKHHDGYCLFDTATTDYCATKTGPGRDLIAPYVEALRNAGLKVGIYFTTMDWYDPDFATIPIAELLQSPKRYEYDPARWFEFHKRFVEQIRELLTNYGRIDLFWFDGEKAFRADRWRSHEVKQMMLNLQPHLVINDRLPEAGDYITPEQYIPFQPPQDWWELCLALNHQWAYHPDPTTYKDVHTLIRILSEVAGKGGNLLLNLGPKADGTWPEEAKERLATIGNWLSHSGEGIYGTERVTRAECFYGPMTRKNQTLYFHLFDLPQSSVEVRGVNGKIKQIRLLKDGRLLKWTESKGYGTEANQFRARFWIDVPQQACDAYNTIIAVDFEEGPIFS
ncbi:alpha-L-fucosidase [Paenibacillus koleovorans]|uniref:alpha-L-fucosidase n=1 Tax=Paenibacillus koleovorans TaxID=121608 RepID=UPI000FD8BF1F|nr:alpha-L-fucosidase [Paenibacillus koleovorans]